MSDPKRELASVITARYSSFDGLSALGIAAAIVEAGWVSPEEHRAVVERADDLNDEIANCRMAEYAATIARAEALAAQWRAEPYPTTADSGWNQGHDMRRESDAYALTCALAEPDPT